MLQNAGGGDLMTLAQALLDENIPRRLRGSYQGYLSANIVAGTTIGPVVGGFLTQAWRWHAVFFAYLQVGLITVILLMRLLSDVRTSRSGRFDLLGMMLLTGFIVPLLLLVSQLQRISTADLTSIGGLIALTGAALAELLWQQRRVRATSA